MRKKKHGRPSVHWKKRWVDIYLNLVFRLVFVGLIVIEVRKLGLGTFLCLTCVTLTFLQAIFWTGYRVCEGWQKCLNFLLTKLLEDFKLFLVSDQIEIFPIRLKIIFKRSSIVWLSVCLSVQMSHHSYR